MLQDMKILPLGLAICMFIGVSAAALAGEDSPSATSQVQVAFGRDCEGLLVSQLNQGTNSIRVAIYSMTRRSIRDALVRAAKRGATVTVKYDKESSEWPGMKQAIGYMRKRDVKCLPIERSGKYAKMHHKFAIIDGARVLTGSFNYSTTASQSNDENLVLLDSMDVAAAFLAEFDRIKSD